LERPALRGVLQLIAASFHESEHNPNQDGRHIHEGSLAKVLGISAVRIGSFFALELLQGAIAAPFLPKYVVPQVQRKVIVDAVDKKVNEPVWDNKYPIEIELLEPPRHSWPTTMDLVHTLAESGVFKKWLHAIRKVTSQEVGNQSAECPERIFFYIEQRIIQCLELVKRHKDEAGERAHALDEAPEIREPPHKGVKDS